MASTIRWEKNIGRRLPLRDLQVFFTVADRGSMVHGLAVFDEMHRVDQDGFEIFRRYDLTVPERLNRWRCVAAPSGLL